MRISLGDTRASSLPPKLGHMFDELRRRPDGVVRRFRRPGVSSKHTDPRVIRSFESILVRRTLQREDQSLQRRADLLADFLSAVGEDGLGATSEPQMAQSAR